MKLTLRLQKQTFAIQIGYTQSYKLAKDPKLFTKTQYKCLNLHNPALFTKMITYQILTPLTA